MASHFNSCTLVVLAILQLSTSVRGQQANINGTVTNSAGGAIPGASVRLLANTLMAPTDAQGKYVLNGTVNNRGEAALISHSTLRFSGNKLQLDLVAAEEFDIALYDLSGRKNLQLVKRRLEKGKYAFPIASGDRSLNLGIIRIAHGNAVKTFKTVDFSGQKASWPWLASALAKSAAAAALDTIEVTAAGYISAKKPVENWTGAIDFILQTQSAVTIFYDTTESPVTFAAQEVQKVLRAKGLSASMQPLTALPASPGAAYVVIAKSSPQLLVQLTAAGGKAVSGMGEQAYSLRVTGTAVAKGYWAIGGDRIGAMYGGITISEIAAGSGLAAVADEDKTPFISKRGIKFNAPLDDRSPSHDDRSTSSRTNRINMWDMGFWKEYLDDLARQRYNVFSLWNKHPFPQMVKLAAYPNVALNDVMSGGAKVKTMPIDQKIAMWKDVMDYAYDRGIEFHIYTWNVCMNGTSFSESKGNTETIAYLRESVKQAILTYPRLVAIGVTSGENMEGFNDAEKEKWLWDTYGQGVEDAKKIQPTRPIKFIHRYWQTSWSNIADNFTGLTDGYDMEFKYGHARIYSSYNPPFAKNELLGNLPAGKLVWWNLRNDDIYLMRWGDPEYVKQYMLNFPAGRTAGYIMGSDRYCWGRESASKNPTSPKQLENEKHWYSFLLWGRLGYDPETPIDLFEGLFRYRFPSLSNADDLFDALKSASGIVPLVNKFHFIDYDYKWWVESSAGSGEWEGISAFRTCGTMAGTNLITIPNFVKGNTNGTTPVQVADQLEAMANSALTKVSGISAGTNTELAETVQDIIAMSNLGLYYANKIRGAFAVELGNTTLARTHLNSAVTYWQNYGKALGTNYNKVEIAMTGVFDWDGKYLTNVRNDVP